MGPGPSNPWGTGNGERETVALVFSDAHAKYAKSAKVGVGVLTTEYTEYTELCGGAATTKAVVAANR